MTKLNWQVELDSFYDVTPNKGKLQFTNVIASNNPSASRSLVFACHYDSKLMNFKFIAATDSAVPCAMLIYFAKILGRLSQKIQSVRFVTNAYNSYNCYYIIILNFIPADRFEIHIFRWRRSVC